LFVKALALEDSKGNKFVLVTSDLVGIPRDFSDAVAKEVERRTGLARANLLLTVSHTHCGPVLRASLADAYDMPPEEWRKGDAYTEKSKDSMVETTAAALGKMKPARLSHGKGVARFAVNRRQPTSQGVALDGNPKGPVDHDVPVLRVETPDGRL